MEDIEKIKVKDENGQEREADALLLFRLVDTGPEYMVYTFNEKDDNDLVKVYTSLFKETEDGYQLEDIPSEEEWTQIKEVMRKVINENKE